MEIDARIEQREKIVLALMILLVLFFGFLYYLKNRPPSVINYPTTNTKIVAFGDSLLAGVGSTPGNDLVSQLENELGLDIINLGVSGDTTRDGLIRIDEVLSQDAGLVILSLGGNDYIQRMDVSEVSQNMNKLISQIQNDGSMVMLLGVPGYRDLYKNLSETHQTAYVSNILRGLIGRDTYMSDLIHPNDAGYKKITERVSPEVKELYR